MSAERVDGSIAGDVPSNFPNGSDAVAVGEAKSAGIKEA
jgi:hypothetical protein